MMMIYNIANPSFDFALSIYSNMIDFPEQIRRHDH